MNQFTQTILPLFETHRTDWLAQARAAAAQLGANGRIVTADDVRAICPPPDGCDPRVMGAIFAGRQWRKVGYCNSTRSECHGRPIAQFQLVEAMKEAA